ncbi:MAG: CRISPR-associated ring nuclease Csm6 [Xanthomonadales bacterium]|jgi:CRISPR-associated protein (TIGR02584 family)|nr:CRISPR-associated ring nuclease Csm6 [Xanthomonadales bacterium]
MQPHEFPERILVCVAGNTPPIITENLFALAVRVPGRFESETPRFIPTKIIILTTEEGWQTCQQRGLAEQIRSLCQQYVLPEPMLKYELLTTPDGTKMRDVRTTADNLIVADQIAQKIRELSRGDDCAIHASLAGGRKTMSSNLQLAIQLYGREQDRLSHVLVNPLFEFSPPLRALFFPPAQPMLFTLTDSSGTSQAVCSDEMGIELAYIDFLPMRKGLPGRLLEGAVSLEQAIHSARSALVAPSVHFDLERTEIFLGPERLSFSREPYLHFGLYGFLHWWKKHHGTDIALKDVFDQKDRLRPFLIRDSVMGSRISNDARQDRREEEWKRLLLLDKDAFAKKLQWCASNINTAIRESLGPIYLESYKINSAGTGVREPIPRHVKTPPSAISFNPEPRQASPHQLAHDLAQAKRTL